MMFISPKHLSIGFEKYTLDEVIDIFYSRIDGWHLEVADRCINGWSENDTQCINATNLLGQETHHIPDSAWAVLQIVFSYFETISTFKLGPEVKQYKGSGALFVWGFTDVFPEMGQYESVVKRIIYGELRTGLYHSVGSSRVRLTAHTPDSVYVEYDANQDLVRINPHRFVPKLRQHLLQYYKELKDNSNVSLRNKFKFAYEARYGKFD